MEVVLTHDENPQPTVEAIEQFLQLAKSLRMSSGGKQGFLAVREAKGPQVGLSLRIVVLERELGLCAIAAEMLQITIVYEAVELFLGDASTVPIGMLLALRRKFERRWRRCLEAGTERKRYAFFRLNFSRFFLACFKVFARGPLLAL
jgi:hypothetical protein